MPINWGYCNLSLVTELKTNHFNVDVGLEIDLGRVPGEEVVGDEEDEQKTEVLFAEGGLLEKQTTVRPLQEDEQHFVQACK